MLEYLRKSETKLFPSSLVTMIIMALCNVYCEADGLTAWHGIANKNQVYRIMHDSDYLYVSSLGAGVTVIEKATGIQKTYNRANEKSFDNQILDMILYDRELWATGRYYGLGKLSDSGYTKFDMIEAGCISTQWMQGLLLNNPNDILVGGVMAFYQFDGTLCTYSYFFSPLSPMVMVTDIKKNDNGDIFVSCYDYLNYESFFRFSEGELVPIDNPCDRINRMGTFGNSVWLASDGDGLVKYDNGEFTQYNTSNSDIPLDKISDISITEDGTVWIATYSDIVQFIDGEFTSFSLPEDWREEDDCFLSVDVDGTTVYAGTKRHGLVKLDDGSFTIVDLIDNPDFCNTSTIPIRGSSCMDKDGNFLMASSAGLNIYDPDNGDARIIHYSDLCEVCISPVNGDIWIRRTNLDAYTCIERIGEDPLSFTSETLPFFFNDRYFTQMAFDKYGKLWVATGEGLMCYDGEIWESFTEKDAGFPIDNIRCMAFDSSNRLWCGAFGKNRIGNGLIMFDGMDWRNYKTNNSQIPSDFVGSINVDNDDVIWLNCRDKIYPESDQGGFGLTSYDGNTWVTYNTSNSEICSNNIYSIAVDADNKKWLATTGDKGVMSFDGMDWSLYSVDNSGLGLNTAIDITVDFSHDLIWFVQYSNNGVSYAKLNSLSGSVDRIIDDTGESLIGQPLNLFNLQGVKVFSSSCYTGETIPVEAGIYIAVTPLSSRKIIVR